MKLAPIRCSGLVTGAIALLLVAGCGKKSDGADVGTTPAVEVQPAQPAAAPVATTPAQTAAPQTRLAESQAAISSGDYEKAAAALVAAQQMQLSQQQAEAVARQMRQLQSSLAGAVANGDPKAKAAADKLRASATVR